jgi:K+ transporter
VFLHLSTESAPPTLLNLFKLNKVLHELVVFLYILSAGILSDAERVTVENLGQPLSRVMAALRFHGKPQRAQRPAPDRPPEA